MMKSLAPILLCGVLAGCSDVVGDTEPKVDDGKPKTIIGQKTQDIGEFDPNADQIVSDSKVRVETPGLAALEAYGPLVEQASKMGVDRALRMFEATEGRYPKDHAEFMQRIIKDNNIQLPVLPGGAQYKYDVENHKLQVVKTPPADE